MNQSLPARRCGEALVFASGTVARVPDRAWISDASISYDRVAEPYAEMVRTGLDDLPLERDLVDHFARRVLAAGGGPVLDVGCGPGWLTGYLASRGLSVSGVDVSANMLRLARQNNAGPSFAVASLTELPMPDDSLAGVFCWYVLHHVPDEDLASAVAQLARVTRPGGHVMVGGHVGDSVHVKTAGYGGLPMRVLVARRSPDSYRDLLRQAGLLVQATVTLGPDGGASGAVWLARKPSDDAAD